MPFSGLPPRTRFYAARLGKPSSIVLELRVSVDWVLTAHSQLGERVNVPLDAGVRAHAVKALDISRKTGRHIESFGDLVGVLSNARRCMLICRGVGETEELIAERSIGWLDDMLESDELAVAGGAGGVRRTYHAAECRGYLFLPSGSGALSIRSPSCGRLRKSRITTNRTRRRESQEASAASAVESSSSDDDDATASSALSSSQSPEQSAALESLSAALSTMRCDVEALHDRYETLLCNELGVDSICGSVLASAVGTTSISRRAGTMVSRADARFDNGLDEIDVRRLSLLCVLRHLLGAHAHIYGYTQARSVEPTVLHLGVQLYERVRLLVFVGSLLWV